MSNFSTISSSLSRKDLKAAVGYNSGNILKDTAFGREGPNSVEKSGAVELFKKTAVGGQLLEKAAAGCDGGNLVGPEA